MLKILSLLAAIFSALLITAPHAWAAEACRVRGEISDYSDKSDIRKLTLTDDGDFFTDLRMISKHDPYSIFKMEMSQYIAEKSLEHFCKRNDNSEINVNLSFMYNPLFGGRSKPENLPLEKPGILDGIQIDIDEENQTVETILDFNVRKIFRDQLFIQNINISKKYVYQPIKQSVFDNFRGQVSKMGRSSSKWYVNYLRYTYLKLFYPKDLIHLIPIHLNMSKLNFAPFEMKFDGGMRKCVKNSAPGYTNFIKSMAKLYFDIGNKAAHLDPELVDEVILHSYDGPACRFPL